MPYVLTDKILAIRAAAKAEDEANQRREMYDDRGRELPPEAWYWKALDNWLAEYDPQAMPIAHLRMSLLNDAYREFNHRGDALPPMSFWAARDAAHQACFVDPPENIKPTLTPAELHEQKVAPRQIAYEWRWLKENGQPDVDRVIRELESPGSELTPEAIEARKDWHLQQLGFLAPPRDSEEQETNEPEPEEKVLSVEELVRQGANIAQIARVKFAEHGGSLERWAAVADLVADLLHAHLPVNHQAAINEAGLETAERQFGHDAAHAKRHIPVVMPQGEIEGVKLPGLPDILPDVAVAATLDDKIVDLFHAGNDVVAIARELKISTKKVKSTIRNYEDNRPDGWSG